MNKRPPLWVLPALLFALLINSLLFLLLPLLSPPTPPKVDMTAPAAVNIINPREKAPPPEMEKERVEQQEPERPDPEKIRIFQPDLVRPELNRPEMPVVNFENFKTTPKLVGNPDLNLKMFYTADELDQPPRPLVKMPPIYPYKAKRLEIEGYVRVKFLVDTTGMVSRISILEVSPKGVFEDSVLKILPTWKFSPGKILGEPVSSWVVTTIRFELK